MRIPSTARSGNGLFAGLLRGNCSVPLTGPSPAKRAHNLSQHVVSESNLRMGMSTITKANLDDLLGNLDMPEIDEDIRAYQIRLGGVFGEDGKAEVPSYFDRKVDKAEKAIEKGCAVVDLSHYGRIAVTGEGCRQFLHGQSTNAFLQAQPGTGLETVFTDAQGHVLDLARCLVNPNSVMAIVAPGVKETLLPRLEKHVFPADKVRLLDVTAKTAMLVVMGPESDDLLRELQVEGVINQPANTHVLLNYLGKPCIVASGCGLPTVRGYTLIADETVVGELYRSVITKGAKPIGTRDYDRLRIKVGRPAFGKELTGEYNALEARLYHAVNLNKGCYVGQETLAKVHQLGAVRRQLWGLAITGPVSEGEEIVSFEDGEVVGKVTSRLTVEVDGAKRCYALGYVRCRPKGATENVDVRGMEFRIGKHVGMVIEVPGLLQEFPEGAAPPPRKLTVAEEDAEAEAARAKAEKLKALQAQLDAYMEQRMKAAAAEEAAKQAAQAAAVAAAPTSSNITSSSVEDGRAAPGPDTTA